MFKVAPEAVAALLDAKVVYLEERMQLVQVGSPLEQFLSVTEEEARTLNDSWAQMKPKLDTLRMSNVKHQ